MQPPSPVDNRADVARAEEWLTPRQASALVGVSAATLRRWCDAGTLDAITTPGGHRRLARSAVMRLLPGTRSIPAVAPRPGMDARRIVDACRRAARSSECAGRSGLLAGPEHEALRVQGRRLAMALVHWLQSTQPAERRTWLREVEAAAVAHGRIVAASGMSMGDHVELFLRFRGPVLREVALAARREAPDAASATAWLEETSAVLDRALAVAVRVHRRAPVPGSRDVDQVPGGSKG